MAGVVVAVGVVASACGGGERDPLTIYTGRSETLVGPLLEEFSEENDVAIDVRYGDTNDLALLIGTEGDRSPADVYWGQSPGATAYLAEKELLAPLPDERARPGRRRSSRTRTAAGSAPAPASGCWCTTRTRSRRPTCPTRSST